MIRKERSIRIPISKIDLEKYINEIEPLKKGFDLVGDHVVITDQNANILYANKAALENTGYSAEEIIGKNPGDLWGGQMPKEFYEKMWRTIKEKKKPFVGEVQNQRKDGKDYWQEIHIAPVLDADGNVRFFIGIEPNVTDRKEREKFREEFLSIIGHQLRDPLAAINWTLEWLLQNIGLPGSGQKALMDAYRSTRSLADLVSDLLALSRIGRFNPQQDTFDLVPQLNEIIQKVKTANSKVMITFAPEEKTAVITANKSLSYQVFYNLIANAAEYSAKAHGQAAVRLKREGNHYLFSSENNGEPIPIADQPRIFSKLFRSSNAVKIKEKGTGLGLYIARMICDYFGWEISFKSPLEDSRGTAFYVKIKT